ncbi:hypothetical protein SODALDRAFT_12489 [Sodiomyces alkalinus F11]|uniref:Uncharacterized protein n=1 Tax=Sodiomyces alkalinus (strain CBS 110278 / VKM F-3762 / F11) TaxID=1314773 RepID=A0A3N2Q6I1_SODAK|nr:hypothetical protein SODALDRAFT_12489 [Sodiomyces alkalinus F11]ROT42316.1 hypothetical protein SODALDRAFT_12489 [Sodiomyces alkalinus F11]
MTSDQALHRPSISSDLPCPMDLSISPPNSKHTAEAEFPFTSLPYELRQHVYHWIWLQNPLDPQRLNPKTERGTISLRARFREDPLFLHFLESTLYITEAVRSEEKDNAKRGTVQQPKTGENKEEPRLLSPYRPACYLPAALLRCSKQVYREAREVPFRKNEFCFLNRWSSGLLAAWRTASRLAPWQLSVLRQVHIELTLPCPYKWIELCRFFSRGLWRLRLRVTLASREYWELVRSGSLFLGHVDAEQKTLYTPMRRELNVPEFFGAQPPCNLGHELALVKGGLRGLYSLRVLEIELSNFPWSDDEKLSWCSALQADLNLRREGTGAPPVTVTYVSSVDPESSTDSGHEMTLDVLNTSLLHRALMNGVLTRVC